MKRVLKHIFVKRAQRRFIGLAERRKCRIKFNIFAVVLFSTVIFAPCCDDDEDSILVSNPESLIQSVYADATEGESVIKFTTTGAWTSGITEEIYSEGMLKPVTPDWVSISPDQGGQEKAHIVSIRLKENYSTMIRRALITISCGKTSVEITIEQKGTLKGGGLLGKKVSFYVYSCQMNWIPSGPPDAIIVPGLNSPYVPALKAIVTIYDGDEVIGTYQTSDWNTYPFFGYYCGIAIACTPSRFSYTVTLENERNITKEGCLIAGIFISQEEIDSSAQPNAKPGDLKFVDLNGDGRIDSQDAVANGRVNVVVEVDNMIEVVYIAPYETE